MFQIDDRVHIMDGIAPAYGKVIDLFGDIALVELDDGTKTDVEIAILELVS